MTFIYIDGRLVAPMGEAKSGGAVPKACNDIDVHPHSALLHAGYKLISLEPISKLLVVADGL